MIHQQVLAGYFGREFHHHRAPRRHRYSLHAAHRRRYQRTPLIDPVHDFTDHMERGGEVRSAHFEEYAHSVTDLGMQGMIFRECADIAVEHEVGGLLVQQFVDVKLLNTVLTVGACGVELALHHIELVVNLGQSAGRLHQDHAVHAVGDVFRHHGGGAVVYVESGFECLESE